MECALYAINRLAIKAITFIQFILYITRVFHGICVLLCVAVPYFIKYLHCYMVGKRVSTRFRRVLHYQRMHAIIP